MSPSSTFDLTENLIPKNFEAIRNGTGVIIMDEDGLITLAHYLGGNTRFGDYNVGKGLILDSTILDDPVNASPPIHIDLSNLSLRTNANPFAVLSSLPEELMKRLQAIIDAHLQQISNNQPFHDSVTATIAKLFNDASTH